MSEPQPIIGHFPTSAEGVPNRDPTLQDGPEVLSALPSLAHKEYYCDRVNNELEGPDADEWYRWLNHPQNKRLKDEFNRVFMHFDLAVLPKRAWWMATNTEKIWSTLNKTLRSAAGLSDAETLSDANFHELMPDKKRQVLATLNKYLKADESSRWAVRKLLSRNPHLKVVVASADRVAGTGPEAWAEFWQLLNIVAYTNLSFRVRAQDRAKALIRLPDGGFAEFRVAQYRKLTLGQKRRVLAFFDAIESKPVDVPTLRLAGRDLQKLGGKYLEKNPEIARSFERLRALTAFSAVLNLEGGFPSEGEFTGSVFKMLKPDRAAHVTRLLADIDRGADSALVAAVERRYPAVTRLQMRSATEVLLATYPGIARAVNRLRGDGTALTAGHSSAESTDVDQQRFLAAVNKIARRAPESPLTDADLQNLDDAATEAVLNFLGAIQVAFRDGAVIRSVGRLYENLGRAELQMAVKAFRRRTPQTTTRVRAHMLTPEFQAWMKTEGERTSTSAARRRKDAAKPAASEPAWLVSVDKDVMKWASQEALDVTRLNEVSKHVRTAGPYAAPGLRRVKPSIYDLRSAQGGDFRFVAVAAANPERTLTFQAVYRHHRAGGKQLHRGRTLAGY